MDLQKWTQVPQYFCALFLPSCDKFLMHLCDFSTANKQSLVPFMWPNKLPYCSSSSVCHLKKKLIHRNLCNFCTWGGVLRILVAYIIVILFMRSRWQELSCYCICSCIDWRVPFLSATVCWNKWCSLLFIINIPWCWYYKWCFSELICWNNQLWRGTCCFKFNGYARAKKTFDRKLSWNGTRNVPYSMWYQLPPWWRCCPQLVNCWNSFVHFHFCHWRWTSYRYHYTRAEQCSYTIKSYGLQLHCTLVETKGRSLEEIEMSLSPATPGKREWNMLIHSVMWQ